LPCEDILVFSAHDNKLSAYICGIGVYNDEVFRLYVSYFVCQHHDFSMREEILIYEKRGGREVDRKRREKNEKEPKKILCLFVLMSLLFYLNCCL